MSEYTLNQGNAQVNGYLGGVSTEASDAAVKSAGDNSNLISTKLAVVLEKKDEHGNKIEFFGHKDQGDYQPMTVTGLVMNGKEAKFNNPIKVNFVQPRDGEGLLEGSWNNVTHAPINKDAGKLKLESSNLLDVIVRTEQEAQKPVLVKPAQGAPFTEVAEQSGPGTAVGKSNPNAAVDTGRGGGQ